MMRLKLRSFIFASLSVAGVALLSVAPSFSVAHAQSNNQSSTFFELQKLRQEISELRDMVERQQYQIRKMQRAQSGSTNRDQARDRYQSGRPQSDSGPSDDNGSRYSDDPRSNGSGSNGSGSNGSGSNGSGSNGSGSNGSGSNGSRANGFPSTDGAQQPTSGSGGSDFYDQRPGDRRDTSPRAGTYQSNNRPQSDQGYSDRPLPDGIEERVIDAPPATNDRSRNFPPVEERSIGGSSQSGSTLDDRPTGQSDYPNDLPGTALPNSTLPSQQGEPYQPSTDGRFDSTRPGSNPQDSASQEYRSPGSNSVPGDSRAPGGVIAVPPPIDNRSDQANAGALSQGISSVLSEDDLYDKGFGLMKQSKFDEAVSIFEQQLKAYPRGESADDAHYWIAEAMYVSRNLDVAKKHLKTLIRDYPQSQRVPDAMLKTAYIEQQEGNKIEARILFQEIVNHHPKSDAAIAAKNRLAENN